MGSQCPFVLALGLGLVYEMLYVVVETDRGLLWLIALIRVAGCKVRFYSALTSEQGRGLWSRG